MKFRKFGKTVLTAALSSAIVISLSSCVHSFTVGYLYVTGTVTATPSGNGIISGFKIDNNTGKLTALHGLPVASGGANPVRAVLISGGRFVYVLNEGVSTNSGFACGAMLPSGVVNICQGPNITEFAVGGNGILTAQQTFFTQGLNPFRLIADTSGNYLMALDHDAPSLTNPLVASTAADPNPYCTAVVSGAPTCGDITVFSINQTTGRLSYVVNAQLSTATNSQVTYFPVPAEPVDFTLAGGYAMTLSGTPGIAGQIVYPYTYNSTTGALSLSQSTPQIINNGMGVPMAEGQAIVYASAKVYLLDNEPLTVTLNGATTTSPSQILPFTIGTNGALQSQTGGAVQDDPTESSPIYLVAESKGKYIYVANQFGASSATGAGIAGFTIDPASSTLTETPGSPFTITENSGSPNGTGANPQCLLEDPSNQYIYTANADSTITGKLLVPTTGDLTTQRGSGSGTTALTGPATWCFATGRTN